ncbi:MAG: hypothetical protein PHE15_02855 [Dehalococcoidales bacterium]|nr:hypothetical protein [Dehalococcoidales bacterium]
MDQDRCATRYLIPDWQMKAEGVVEHRARLISQMNRLSKERWPKGQRVIRQLLASDLGLKSWSTPRQSAGARTDWIHHTLTEQILCVYGITLLSEIPKVSKIAIIKEPYCFTGLYEVDELQAVLPLIKLAQSQIPKMEVTEMLYLLQSLNLQMNGYFSEPHVWQPHDIVRIAVESPAGNETGDKIMLNGFIAECDGLNILA